MTDSDFEASPDTLTRILEKRARVLARIPVDETQDDTPAYLVLPSGDEYYGVDVCFVRGAQPVMQVASLPGVPALWSGLVNVRGHLYPVLDLRAYLGLSPVPAAQSEASRARHVVLLAAAGLEVGILVDDMPEVRQILRTQIGPPVATTPGQTEVVAGIAPGLLTILDVEAMLSDPRLVVQDETI